MPDIIKHLMKGVSIGAVVVALIAILMNIKINVKGQEATGIFDILGKASNIDQIDYENMNDIDTFQEVTSKKRPEIKYIRPETIEANHAINVISLFSVVEYDGAAYVEKNAVDLLPERIYVDEILDNSNTSIINTYDPATRTITFSESNVYSIMITLRDQENRENTMTVKVPVRSERP